MQSSSYANLAVNERLVCCAHRSILITWNFRVSERRLWIFVGHVCVCFYRLFFDVTIYNNYIWWKTEIKIMTAAFVNVLEMYDWQTTYSFTKNRVLPSRFKADVDSAYEKWKTVDASCIAGVREITTACTFQEPVDEERLSEMLTVSLHLISTKPL